MRKYYPLTPAAWEQAKADLSSVFPDARFSRETMQDEATMAISVGFRCHMIDPFMLEDELKRAGIMREHEWFGFEFLERIPNGKRAWEIVNALVCPEPPWIDELTEEEAPPVVPPPPPLPPLQTSLF